MPEIEASSPLQLKEAAIPALQVKQKTNIIAFEQARQLYSSFLIYLHQAKSFTSEEFFHKGQTIRYAGAEPTESTNENDNSIIVLISI